VVTFNEIMYHPATNETALEWVELYNQMAVDVDLSEWRLRGGISYEFPPGTVLPGGGYAVIAVDPAAVGSAHGISGVYGPFDGRLSNAGETLRLRNHDGRIMDELTYDDQRDWPPAADGSGVSLARIEQDMGAADPGNWSWSRTVGGTPGGANAVHLPGTSPLVINEIAAATGTSFWVELHNPSATGINPAGYRIASKGVLAGSYTFPSQTIPAGGFLVLDDSTLGFWAFDESKLFLYDDGSTVLDAAVVKNRARARYPDGAGEWRRPAATTPGASNAVTLCHDVVINEIMYHHQSSYDPYTESDEEWVELFNRGTGTVDLGGWELDDGIRFDFPSNTLLGAGDFLVVAKDTNAFLAAFPAVTNAIGDYAGRLANGGEKVVLRDPAGNPADAVRYYDARPWPALADGGGSSLELRDPDADNANAGAWAASDETGKSTWQTVIYRGTATEDGIGHNIWHEFCLCLLGPGEVLLDDFSVIEAPGGAAIQFIQNGDFESDTLGTTPAAWRLLGTHGSHGRSVVTDDPVSPGNRALHLVSTGDYEHEHNHAETTFAGGQRVVAGREYEISFRAKWLAGSPQVNTRLYFNWLQRTTHLATPQTNGTPGRANSRLEANAGPTCSGLSHAPVVPAAGEAVTVSVRAADPDGVAALRVFYSVNGGAWLSAAMAGADGDFLGTIPGQAASARVQFYVRGQDDLGAVATCPAAGPDSRAMYRVQDGLADLGTVHNFRVVMTAADRDAMYAETERMSNYRRGGTVIYDERLVYYDVDLRLKGAAGRGHYDYAGLNIEFPADRLFRGVHRTVAIERQSWRQILSKHMFSKAGGGLASLYDDVAHVIMPRSADTGRELLAMARYTDVFLDGWLENGSDGNDFNHELLYTPTSTVDGNPESLKRNFPYTHTAGALDLADYGPDQEAYRWNFLLRNNRRRDDYTGIIDLCRAFSLAGDALDVASRDVLDVSQWMRTFVMQSLIGNSDTYSRVWRHNFRMIERPEDGRLLAAPWDLDASFALSTGASLWGGDNVKKLIELPGNRRLFYGHALEMINTTCNTAYMSRWTTHYGSLLGQNFSGHLSWIGGRSAYVLSQLPSDRTTFAVTNTDFTVDTDYAVIGGQAGIAIHEIRLDGQDTPIETWWTTEGSGTAQTFHWQATVPVSPGAHSLRFEAIGFGGETIGSDSVWVTSTVAERPLHDYLRVSEVMYNPADDGDREFIELHNRGPVALDLADVRLVEGVTFSFAAGAVHSLPPGARVLVVRDLQEFAARYSTNGLLIAGEYEGSLSNGGEDLAVLGEYGEELISFEYDDGRGWPLAADGAGHSLVLSVMDGQESGVLDYGGNWRASAFIGGSPARVDPTPVVDVLINEFAAHTDTGLLPPDDSDDWIELHSVSNMTLIDWYLSDDGGDLKKWRIPPDSVITAGGWLTFHESTGFHSNRVDGFGLDKAGEQVFLSYLPGTDRDRVADCVSFESQENGVSSGRYPDGDELWYVMALTPDASNRLAAVEPVISQIMYHPRPAGTNTYDNTEHEYLVIRNDAGQDIQLWNAAGPWRISGIGYTLPSNTVIGAGEALAIVPFDPNDSVAVSNFAANHNLLGTLPVLLGPHDGTLSNTGERIALERPQAPDVVGDDVSWVIVDEVIYSSAAPWPGASVNGTALRRIDLRHSGNDPLNWTTVTVQAPKGLPFAEGFEGYGIGSSLDGQDPDGSHPWAAAGVVVTNSPVQAGDRAAVLTSETAVAAQTFNDGQTEVWTDLHCRPVFVADNPGMAAPPAGCSFAFYVHTNGQVVAYNGALRTELAHAPLTEGRWTRFTVHSDHTTRTWDLYLNGNPAPIATGLNFFDSTPEASYTEFGIRGAGPSNACVDSIRIDTNAPAMNAVSIGTVMFGR